MSENAHETFLHLGRPLPDSQRGPPRTFAVREEACHLPTLPVDPSEEAPFHLPTLMRLGPAPSTEASVALALDIVATDVAHFAVCGSDHPGRVGGQQPSGPGGVAQVLLRGIKGVVEQPLLHRTQGRGVRHPSQALGNYGRRTATPPFKNEDHINSEMRTWQTYLRFQTFTVRRLNRLSSSMA